MKRELPVYNIEGTDFIVDVGNLQLREKANPENVLHVLEMWDAGDGYEFLWLPEKKNMVSLFVENEGLTRIKIPELVELDPAGMAGKYGYPPEAMRGKKDFDIMVDQDILKQRLAGRLPTIHIMGHAFYVDLQKDMLRSKDDSVFKDISFSRISDHYDFKKEAYMIPYNPKSHEFQKLDYENITSIPNDLIVVSFPHEFDMDPVGYNKEFGFADTYGLKIRNLQVCTEAKIVDWKDTGIEQVILKNIKKLRNREQELKQTAGHKPSRRQRKGPKL